MWQWNDETKREIADYLESWWKKRKKVHGWHGKF
jgi:hypothetical protein